MNNTYVIRGDVGVIFVDAPPNAGCGYLEVLVDPADLDLLKAWPGTWFGFINKSNDLMYFRGTRWKTPVEGYSQTQPLLHRVIAQPPKGYNTTHKDGNTLDCRRCNLVNVRIGQAYEPPKPVDPSTVSVVRGVHYRPEKQRFECAVFHKGKKYYLGIYPIDAYEEANRIVTEFRAVGPEVFFNKYPDKRKV